MAHDVFISHSNKDKPVADAACAILERNGIRCWMAPRDIQPGMSWAEAIIDAIGESRVMLLIFSGHADRSQQVLREVQSAVSEGVAILPFRIEDAPLSKAMKYFIGVPHWLDAVTPPMEKRLDEMAEKMKALLAQVGPKPTATPDAKVPANAIKQEFAEAPDVAADRDDVRHLKQPLFSKASALGTLLLSAIAGLVIWINSKRLAFGVGLLMLGTILAAVAFFYFGGTDTRPSEVVTDGDQHLTWEPLPAPSTTEPDTSASPAPSSAVSQQSLSVHSSMPESTSLPSAELGSVGAELVLRGHRSAVFSVAFSLDGQRIVSGSADKTVRAWDSNSGEELENLRGHMGHVLSVDFSPDGTQIVSGAGGVALEPDGEDFSVRLWTPTENGRPGMPRDYVQLGAHQSDVECVAFSPDGLRVVSGSKDATVRVWDAQTGTEVLVLRHSPLDSWVWSVAFSPDGKRIASGSNDKTVRLWDADSGEEVAVLRGHEDWVRGVGFSADGMRIVSGSTDDTIIVWDAATCEQLAYIRGQERLRNVALSPDGGKVVSASFGTTIRVWDVESGAKLAVINADHTVFGVAFSPDGKRLAACTGLTVRVWDISDL